MKLAFCLFKYFPYGGMQRDLMATINACHQQGHQVNVYCMHWQGPKPGWLRVHKVKVDASSNHQRAKKFSSAVKPLLKKNHYDAVIGFNRTPNLDLYFAADDCFSCQKKYRRWWRRFTSRFRVFKKLEQAVFAHKSKTQILCLTERQKQQYQKCYHTTDERMQVLSPNLPLHSTVKSQQPTDKQQLRKSFNIAEKDFMLVSIASAPKTKGIDRSLIALSSLPENLQQHCHLIVIGKGKSEPLLKLAKKLKLPLDRIHFIGSQDPVLPYLLSADLFLHPARKEAGGIVLLEAITAGLPIITTEICGYAEIVKKSQSGKVMPEPFSQEYYNKALRKCLHHHVLQEYQQNAARYASQLIPGKMIEEVVTAIEAFKTDS